MNSLHSKILNDETIKAIVGGVIDHLFGTYVVHATDKSGKEVILSPLAKAAAFSGLKLLFEDILNDEYTYSFEHALSEHDEVKILPSDKYLNAALTMSALNKEKWMFITLQNSLQSPLQVNIWHPTDDNDDVNIELAQTILRDGETAFGTDGRILSVEHVSTLPNNIVKFTFVKPQ